MRPRAPPSIRRAAARGFNLLLDQYAAPEAIGERIALYRRELEAAGYAFDPMRVAVARNIYVAKAGRHRGGAGAAGAINQRTVAVSRGPTASQARTSSPIPIRPAGPRPRAVRHPGRDRRKLDAVTNAGAEYVLLTVPAAGPAAALQARHHAGILHGTIGGPATCADAGVSSYSPMAPEDRACPGDPLNLEAARQQQRPTIVAGAGVRTMRVYYDRDADINLIKGKKVAIIGYGSQGHAHALNLRDFGVKDVAVALRQGSQGVKKAEGEKLRVMDVTAAAKWADVMMMLTPDEWQADIYREHLADNMKNGTAAMFAHGLNIQT